MAGGLAGLLERVIGGNDPLKDFSKLGKAGEDLFKTGIGTTNEGLFGLRGDLKMFDERLRNPLGDEGESIFRQARGQIADSSVRQRRGFAAGLAERARQSGGTLSPAAIAELDQQTQRDLAESQFTSEFNLSREHAGLVLSETNKLFDRRNDIRKTMLGIGEADKDRGLAAWLAKLNLQHNRNAAIAATIAATTGGIGSSGPQPSGGNPGG